MVIFFQTIMTFENRGSVGVFGSTDSQVPYIQLMVNAPENLTKNTVTRILLQLIASVDCSAREALPGTLYP